jgi:hypothetical protein
MKRLQLARHQPAVASAEVSKVAAVLVKSFRLVLTLAGVQKKIAERGNRLVGRIRLHLTFVSHQPAESPVSLFLIVLAFDQLDLLTLGSDRNLRVRDKAHPFVEGRRIRLGGQAPRRKGCGSVPN